MLKNTAHLAHRLILAAELLLLWHQLQNVLFYAVSVLSDRVETLLGHFVTPL